MRHRAMAASGAVSKVLLTSAPTFEPRGKYISCETSASFLPIQPKSHRSHRPNLRHESSELTSRKPSGLGFRGRAMAGHLAVLSSAGIVDQNERLKDAAKEGNLDTLNDILGLAEVSVDLPSSSRAGWTALHLACFYGHATVVESLLKAGANVEVRNQSGNTPLQLACLKGNAGIASILLESGADLYAESADRGTALDYAQEWGGEDIVDFLLLWAAKSSHNL